MLISSLLVFIFSFVLSLISTRFFIWLSFKINFLDHPLTLARKNHEKSTPLLGGASVFFSYIFVLFFSITIIYLLKDKLIFFIPDLNKYFDGIFKKLNILIAVFFGGFLIFILGLKDDKVGTTPKTKLFIISLVALILCYLNVKITFFINYNFFNFIFTFLWMAFLTNSFNLLDNMDGLSSGVAIVCSIFLAIIAVLLNQFFILLFLIAFIGALLGFFRYNFLKGTIYLGDSGALFVGYNLCVASILESFYITGQTSQSSVFIPLLIFSVPFYDTLSVIFIRIKNKQPIYKGDLNHFSHRLLNSGYKKKTVVTIIIGITSFTGILSLILLFLFKINLLSFIFIYTFIILFIYFIEIIIKKISKKLK